MEAASSIEPPVARRRCRPSRWNVALVFDQPQSTRLEQVLCQVVRTD
jgi:hypothetical protein